MESCGNRKDSFVRRIALLHTNDDGQIALRLVRRHLLCVLRPICRSAERTNSHRKLIEFDRARLHTSNLYSGSCRRRKHTHRPSEWHGDFPSVGVRHQSFDFLLVRGEFAGAAKRPRGEIQTLLRAIVPALLCAVILTLLRAVILTLLWFVILNLRRVVIPTFLRAVILNLLGAIVPILMRAVILTLLRVVILNLRLVVIPALLRTVIPTLLRIVILTLLGAVRLTPLHVHMSRSRLHIAVGLGGL